MARGIAGDHTAFLHQLFCRETATNADNGRRLAQVTSTMRFDDRSDSVGEAGACHRTGACVQVGKKRDSLLTIPGPFDGRAPQRDQLTQLVGSSAVSILKYERCSISLAIRAKKRADSAVPLAGAS